MNSCERRLRRWLMGSIRLKLSATSSRRRRRAVKVQNRGKQFAEARPTPAWQAPTRRRRGIYQDGERALRAVPDVRGHDPSSGARAAMITPLR